MADAPADPKPYFDHHVFVCINRREAGHRRGCCAEKDSEELRDYMKAKAKAMGIRGIRVNSAGCLDRCELGPNMVIYPEGVWYRPASFADVDEILQTHLVDGGRVTRLMLKPEDGPTKG